MLSGWSVTGAPKFPEGLEQACLCFGGQVVRADIAERGDGFADLFHVPRATGAQVEVRFEGGGGVGVEVAFEVVGDQFDDLAAAEHTRGRSPVTPLPPTLRSELHSPPMVALLDPGNGESCQRLRRYKTIRTPRGVLGQAR